MNCIAIDDEPLALEVIQNFCNQFDFLNLTATFSNSVEAFTYLRNNKVDLMFLDINMPHMNGTEFVRTLSNPPKIIFTTAFSEYAIEGFELNAIDYLMKPISLERFMVAINKAYDANLSLPNPRISNNYKEYESRKNTDYVLLKVDSKLQKVFISDILFVECVKDYIKVHTHDNRLLTKRTMINILNHLPEENFCRVHKSFIVALNKIETIENNRIKIRERYIPIGGNYKNQFLISIERKKV